MRISNAEDLQGKFYPPKNGEFSCQKCGVAMRLYFAILEGLKVFADSLNLFDSFTKMLHFNYKSSNTHLGHFTHNMAFGHIAILPLQG